MPNSVDDVKLRNDCGRLRLTGSGVGCRNRGLFRSTDCAGAGVAGEEFSSGGVGLVRLRSKGLRGMGLRRGGPSSAIVL